MICAVATKRTASAWNHGRKAGSDVRMAQMIAACPTNSGVCAAGVASADRGTVSPAKPHQA